jgi:hypothetical protein
MQYKILSVTQVDDGINTTVEMTLSNTTIVVDVAHFRPQSQEEIAQNITNRMITEQSKIDSAAILANLIPQIPIGQTLTV